MVLTEILFYSNLSPKNKKNLNMQKQSLRDLVENAAPAKTPAVYKFGGEFFGSLYHIENPLLKLLAFFAKVGIPSGFVYSAPKGLTAALETLLGFSCGKNEQREQAKIQLKKIFADFTDTFTSVFLKLQADFPELQGTFAEELKRVNEEWFKRREKLLSEALAALESYPDKGDEVAAIILSLGERAFGELVLHPAFELLSLVVPSKFPAFVPIYPKANIVSADKKYLEVLPSVVESVRNIRGNISVILEHAPKNMAFFMPGFFLGVEGGKKIGCMPWNGSDISALLLYLAMFSNVGLDKVELEIRQKGNTLPVDGELVYVKSVEGEVPSMNDLINLQESSRGEGQKPKELISQFALFQLRNRGISPRIYDMRKDRMVSLPLE